MSKIVVGSIKIYQRIFSPFIHSLNVSVFGFSSVCRQTHKCSQYTINKVKEHGTILGLYYGLKRILSCKH